MGEFIASHIIEIIFGLISAGALAFCKYLHTQLKNYQKLLDERKIEQLEETIDARIEPIQQELEELRTYIRDVGLVEKNHIDLIVSSYRFRLVQLCKEFIKQGYLLPEQYDQLTEFYKLYSSLGGNGQAKDYYESAMKLRIINDLQQK